jgi:hypothetical protein
MLDDIVFYEDLSTCSRTPELCMQLVFDFLPFEAFFTILFQLFDPKESWKFSLQTNSP